MKVGKEVEKVKPVEMDLGRYPQQVYVYRTLPLVVVVVVGALRLSQHCCSPSWDQVEDHDCHEEDKRQ